MTHEIGQIIKLKNLNWAHWNCSDKLRQFLNKKAFKTHIIGISSSKFQANNAIITVYHASLLYLQMRYYLFNTSWRQIAAVKVFKN